ncbi:hypothetical protein E8D34_11135 [Nocardioides sp. GY 10113]|uniref:hypothetical protein n=1 Tax=Nocardioides sp. GY 10113 TaxID=2569761 RepID=UPI0010A760E6|nr:hypothetical protein [Nocardioides sp. GY 10113]TIC86784.1 hypothetical protein E8D34_11135 [Nocardioides sp. GY 10113]
MGDLPAVTARPRRLLSGRGAAAGLVAAFGALVAHVASGGAIEVAPGVVAIAIALPLGTAMTRGRRADLRRLAVVAVAVQGAGHLTLMTTPGGAGGASAVHEHGASGIHPTVMALLHLLVAVATVAVAAGVDRAILVLVGDLVARFLPRLRGSVSVPVRRVTHGVGRHAVATIRAAVGGLVARGPPWSGPRAPAPLTIALR